MLLASGFTCNQQVQRPHLEQKHHHLPKDEGIVGKLRHTGLKQDWWLNKIIFKIPANNKYNVDLLSFTCDGKKALSGNRMCKNQLREGYKNILFFLVSVFTCILCILSLINSFSEQHRHVAALSRICPGRCFLGDSYIQKISASTLVFECVRGRSIELTCPRFGQLAEVPA